MGGERPRRSERLRSSRRRGERLRSRRRGERERLRDGRRRLRDESLDDDELELELEDEGERRPMVASASLADVYGCSQSGNDAEQQRFRAMRGLKERAALLVSNAASTV